MHPQHQEPRKLSLCREYEALLSVSVCQELGAEVPQCSLTEAWYACCHQHQSLLTFQPVPQLGRVPVNNKHNIVLVLFKVTSVCYISAGNLNGIVQWKNQAIQMLQWQQYGLNATRNKLAVGYLVLMFSYTCICMYQTYVYRIDPQTEKT